MFEPKCEWADKIKKEDYPVLLKGMLKVKRGNYGRFVELAMSTGLKEAVAGDFCEEEQGGEWWFDVKEKGVCGILEWLGFMVNESEEGIEGIYFDDWAGRFPDDMGQAVFAACAPVIEEGSVLAFVENWDEGAEGWPRVWRYTFDGEKMQRQEGRFAFDD